VQPETSPTRTNAANILVMLLLLLLD
jgi:hypothetical protein